MSSSLDEMRKLLLQNGYPSGVLKYNINDVLNRQENRSKQPTTTVPKKEVLLILPYLGLQSSSPNKGRQKGKGNSKSINSTAALTFELFSKACIAMADPVFLENAFTFP